MHRELKIKIDEKTYQYLIKLCKGNIKALEKMARKILTEKVQDQTSMETFLNTEGLDDYLKTSKSGSRDYGAKKQGW